MEVENGVLQNDRDIVAERILGDILDDRISLVAKLSIGNNDTLYYCFPKDGDVVAKTRLAAEELYKMKKTRKTPTAV